MAGDEDEIVVTIEGEAAPVAEDTIVKIEDGTTKKAAAETDDIVGALKAQLAEKQTALDSATQRASSAETVAGQAAQRARQLEQEVVQARTEAQESTKTTIDSGIAAAKSEVAAAKQAYKTAFESGNADACADAQERIAQAAADLRMLEQAKDTLPTRVERKPEPQQHPAPNDPVEAFISSRTAPTQTWLRAHRDFLTDPKKNAKMQAAHFDAEAEGIPLDSPQYFEHVERFLGLKEKPAQQQQQQTTQQQQTQSQRRPTAPVAPVTPSGGGISGGATEVRLTAAEARAATDGTLIWNYDDPTGKGRFKKGDAIGVQEMARRKAALTKEGRYLNANVDGT